MERILVMDECFEKSKWQVSKLSTGIPNDSCI